MERILINFKDGSRIDEVVEEVNVRILCKSLNEREFVLINKVIVQCSEVSAIKVIKEATIS